MVKGSEKPLRVDGDIFPATRDGFVKFLIHANEQEAKGYVLIALVRLDTSLAAVFRRMKTDPGEFGAFFSETPEADAEDW